MKKNLMSVLILALVVVNLVLTAITMISIVPSAKRSNALITEICTALNLELASGRNANLSSVKIEDIATFTPESSMTSNLKDSQDGTEHYAIVNFSISMDTTNEDYEKKSVLVTDNVNLIKGVVNDVISSFTKEDLKNNMEEAQKMILERLQGLYDSNFIIDVSFPQINYE